jgi:hypothetical protein
MLFVVGWGEREVGEREAKVPSLIHRNNVVTNCS